MKKIVLSALVSASLLISAEVAKDQEQLKKDIAQAKADIKELEYGYTLAERLSVTYLLSYR